MSSRIIKPLCTALALTIGAAIFWQAYTTFQARYLRPFDNQTTLFDGSQLQLPAELAGPGQI
ncbi:thiol-disulfide isomerase, partial [Pseudomonas kurunegalensis]|nr:thiol-disulfide isomerase [Pseudomonas kurunegalensis]